ncbi:MAG: ribose 5-phosphate isomerase B [Eggerthellaceae bacterium]|nr:ribose 5-phosphate isomerase B [Eggerthellaceae bacterium]
MKISIASDHGGFEQKEPLKTFLSQEGHEVIDRGPATDERVDYPDFAALVAHDVVQKVADVGVLICGTGIGMAISANKLVGIRAANVTTPDFAELSREHNDANVICLSGRFTDLATNKAILGVFLHTKFGEGRHVARVQKIGALEQSR